MKVLHLSSGNLYGGIETLLTTMARFRHLALEMEPEFGLCFRGRSWSELAATGAMVHDLGSVRLSRPWSVWRARRRLRQILTDSRPQVVIIHGSWPHAVFGPEVRRDGVRLVHFVHGELTGRHWLERWAARTSPDLVIANSRFTAKSVESVFPDIPVEIIHLPIAPPALIHPVRFVVRSELGTSDGTVVILQVSRLERWKGHAVHLSALGRLGDVPGWECWLVGGVQRKAEADFLRELQSMAEQAGITNRVRFLGQRVDIAQLMAEADVFCQPNVHPEPFGIVFIEAQYAGLPVVTSGFGGAIEIVDETCGILTIPSDISGVAMALRELILDKSRRQSLGSAGVKRAEALCNPARQLVATAKLMKHLCNINK